MALTIFLSASISDSATTSCLRSDTYRVMAYIRARKYLTVTVAYGTCTMPIWLTTTCPETLIVTLWDVLASDNAKNRVNLTCSVCARCGDEVLCGAEMPFLDVCK